VLRAASAHEAAKKLIPTEGGEESSVLRMLLQDALDQVAGTCC
jgi:hypothetical protein